MALVALDELVEKAHSAPLPPTWSLRFLLAFLYAVGDEEARDCFDEFWREAQSKNEWAWSDDQARYCRFTRLRSLWRGIARGVGAPETVDFDIRVRTAWRRKGSDPGATPRS